MYLVDYCQLDYCQLLKAVILKATNVISVNEQLIKFLFSDY